MKKTYHIVNRDEKTATASIEQFAKSNGQLRGCPDRRVKLGGRPEGLAPRKPYAVHAYHETPS